MYVPICVLVLIAAIVYVQYTKREGLESTTCKTATQMWDTQGPDIFTPVCGTQKGLNVNTNECKPYGPEGCIAPFVYGHCPGTLEYKNGKCVPPPI
jgi:hypothetical protein